MCPIPGEKYQFHQIFRQPKNNDGMFIQPPQQNIIILIFPFHLENNRTKFKEKGEGFFFVWCHAHLIFRSSQKIRVVSFWFFGEGRFREMRFIYISIFCGSIGIRNVLNLIFSMLQSDAEYLNAFLLF